MQKLLTITIDLEYLKETSKGPFSISEIEEINSLFEAGFFLEEWKFLTKDDESEKTVLLLVLNNGLDEDDFDDIEYMNTDEEEEETGDESPDSEK